MLIIINVSTTVIMVISCQQYNVECQNYRRIVENSKREKSYSEPVVRLAFIKKQISHKDVITHSNFLVFGYPSLHPHLL